MDIQIIMGSKSDTPVAEKAEKILDQFNVEYNIKIASAHRTPEYLQKLVEESDADVFIGIAGLSAALPGSIAAHTAKPVIGVPVSGKVNFDSILSIIQMPPGIPVAAVGLDRGDNAALLAIQILSIKNDELKEEIKQYREKRKNKTIKDNQ
ncbi:MAG: 5-(carboxyamino)imidazole ribonucleotide mutase [Candidatus Thermoplasmatota archaeon]